MPTLLNLSPAGTAFLPPYASIVTFPFLRPSWPDHSISRTKWRLSGLHPGLPSRVKDRVSSAAEDNPSANERCDPLVFGPALAIATVPVL